MGDKLHRMNANQVVFFCPACKHAHHVAVAGPGAPWGWNGSMTTPTFFPSIRTSSGHFIPGHTGACWCTYNAEHPDNPSGFQCECCHSFVTSGKIQFLADCTHALAGQTVYLPDWD
jgi:hypothetical protein